MIRPVIKWEVCQTCQPCQARLVCKTRALVKYDPEEPAYIEYARCNSCGLCVLACSCSAIKMINSSVPSGNADGCLPFR
jgi:Pyruvate/2-oxoacid:ferredoxin oxidoreductase delta subunit